MRGVDPHNLERFLAAQDENGTFEEAIAELRGGHKTSHWMWFVFPQLIGLGRSPMSRRFAIASLDEARAYLAHPVLGARIRTCASTVAGSERPTAEAIFGELDASKLRSSMTLFLRASPEDRVFADVLDRFFAGEADPATDRLLRENGP